MTIVLAVGGVAAFGGLVLWLVRKSQPVGEAFFRANCPACRQKLRFPERQAGHPAACPRCKKLHVLPAGTVLRATD